MLIGKVIARVLALVDWFLAQFVTLTAVPAASPNNCWTFNIYATNVTACGAEFMTNLTDLVEGLVALIPALLGALFSV
jgi:hypothetical protein